MTLNEHEIERWFRPPMTRPINRSRLRPPRLPEVARRVSTRPRVRVLIEGGRPYRSLPQGTAQHSEQLQ